MLVLFSLFHPYYRILQLSISELDIESHINKLEDFPGGPVVKNPSTKAGDKGSISGPGISHRLRSN